MELYGTGRGKQKGRKEKTRKNMESMDRKGEDAMEACRKTPEP